MNKYSGNNIVEKFKSFVREYDGHFLSFGILWGLAFVFALVVFSINSFDVAVWEQH